MPPFRFESSIPTRDQVTVARREALPRQISCGAVLDSPESGKQFCKYEASFSVIVTVWVGMALLTGCGGKPGEAVFRKTFADAEKGDAQAQLALGLLYARGEGVGRDDVAAAKWFRKSAEQNHRDAQFNLGISYMTGEGVTRDSSEELKWFQKAADQNHADAQFNLGVAYAQGEIVPKDLKRAAEWLTRAAEQNHAEAQSKLAFMYASGAGVARDPVRAHAWWNVAAANGDPDARRNLTTLEKEMTPQAMNEAVALARQLAEQKKAQ